MEIKISKRKLRSYERAEVVCRELRYQLTNAQRWDANTLCAHLHKWMNTTGDVKYERPPLPNAPVSNGHESEPHRQKNDRTP